MRRLAGFGSATAVTGLVNVLIVPVIIATVGTEAWAAVAIGTAAGALGSVLSGYGWSVTGPGTIGAMSPAERPAYYKLTLLVRGGLALPALLLACSAAFVVAPAQYRLDSAVIAAAFVMAGLNANWYFVGANRPAGILLTDALPRCLANLLAASLLAVGAGLWAYSWLQVVAAAYGAGSAWWQVGRGARISDTLRGVGGRQRVLAELRVQFSGFLVGAVASFYQSVPALVLPRSGSGAVATFALADRVSRLANTVQSPYSQSMQSWVPIPRGEMPDATRYEYKYAVSAKAMRATKISFGVAAVSGLVMAVGAPLAGRALGAGHLSISATMSLLMGGALSLTILTQTIGIACLVALGKRRYVAYGSFAGGMVAAMCVVPFTFTWHAEGAMGVVVAAEIAVFAVEFCALVGARRMIMKSTDHRTGSAADAG